MKWRNIRGEAVEISSMSNDYLHNCLEFCKRRNAEGVHIPPGSFGDMDTDDFEVDHNFYDDFIEEFEKEITKRKQSSLENRVRAIEEWIRTGRDL